MTPFEFEIQLVIRLLIYYYYYYYYGQKDIQNLKYFIYAPNITLNFFIIYKVWINRCACSGYGFILGIPYSFHIVVTWLLGCDACDNAFSKHDNRF